MTVYPKFSYPIGLLMASLGNDTFPHEAILGRAFSSALGDGGNASPRAEEKALPRIASCGKVSLPNLSYENLKSLKFHYGSAVFSLN